MSFERIEGQDRGYVEADLLNTEDKKKVLTALNNLFPNSKFREMEGKLVGDVDLTFFKKILEKEKIRAAIESVLDENITGQHSYINLNKSAALYGKVALDEDSPVGKIRLQVPWKKA